MENPDFDKFPLLNEARGQRIVLKAGEVLYIPEGHWHYVKSLSDLAISLSMWFVLRNRFVKL